MRSSYKKILASNERMGRGERTGRLNVGVGSCREDDITEPALLFSISPASWKQESNQGCLERANRGK